MKIGDHVNFVYWSNGKTIIDDSISCEIITIDYSIPDFKIYTLVSNGMYTSTYENCIALDKSTIRENKIKELGI